MAIDGDRQFGEFFLLERLARGTHSDVFLAVKTGPKQFSKAVVIKALPARFRDDEQFTDLFFQEAYISCRLNHPHCVSVHDARIIDGIPCMIMDLIPGQTIADLAQRSFSREEPLDVEESVRIVADAAAGLHYAHEFQDVDNSLFRIVHRDVSPQNLMVTYLGRTIVFDFGVAKVTRGQRQITLLRGGKFAYMSPEQCLGEETDRRSDIFSLGVILYELLAQTRLFRQSSDDQTVRAITEESVPPPSTYRSCVPDELDEISLKALEKNRNDRFETAGQFRDALEAFLTDKDISDGRVKLGETVSQLFREERMELASLIREGTSLRAEAQNDPGDAQTDDEQGASGIDSSNVAQTTREVSADQIHQLKDAYDREVDVLRFQRNLFFVIFVLFVLAVGLFLWLG